jgi:hypothetical protein
MGKIDRFKRWPQRLIRIATTPLHHRDIARDIAAALARGALGKALLIARTAGQTSDLGAGKIVSRKYRYLWIGNPKVASRSIIAALRSADPNAEIIHNKSVSELYAMHQEVRDYYSFAFIRQPFTRAFSLYSELHFSHKRYTERIQIQQKEEKRRSLFDQFYGLAETSNFDDFCRWLNTPYGSDAYADRHFLSQHVQIRLEDGRLPDFIGRFENIAADLNRVAVRLGMPVPALPMLNTMAGWQTTPEALKTARSAVDAHLTERNKALLRTRYQDDFKLGGYSSA